MEAYVSLDTVLDIVQLRGCERGLLKIGGDHWLRSNSWHGGKLKLKKCPRSISFFFFFIIDFFEGMEIYSTTLWHLQKEVTLSALAQDLVETDRTSPQVRKTAILERSDFLLYVLKPNVLHQFNGSSGILNHSHWCFCCFYSIFCFCFVFVAYCLLGVSYYAVLVSEWESELA